MTNRVVAGEAEDPLEGVGVVRRPLPQDRRDRECRRRCRPAPVARWPRPRPTSPPRSQSAGRWPAAMSQPCTTSSSSAIRPAIAPGNSWPPAWVMPSHVSGASQASARAERSAAIRALPAGLEVVRPGIRGLRRELAEFLPGAGREDLGESAHVVDQRSQRKVRARGGCLHRIIGGRPRGGGPCDRRLRAGPGWASSIRSSGRVQRRTLCIRRRRYVALVRGGQSSIVRSALIALAMARRAWASRFSSRSAARRRRCRDRVRASRRRS